MNHAKRARSPSRPAARLWETHEIKALRDGFTLLGAKRLAKRLGRSERAVSLMAQRYGLYHHYWQPEEDETLLIHYGIKPVWVVAQLVGRTEDAVHARAHLLGYTKAGGFPL